MQRTTQPRRGRLIWWLCGGLLLIFVCLVLYQFYIRQVRFTVNKELLARLETQTIAQPDDRPIDPKVWLQWRGQRRDGVTTAPDLLLKWPENGPKELWRINGGHAYSSLAVSGDTVYSMTSSAGTQAIVAWDVNTGKERWRRECGSSTSRDHAGYGGPRSTPTLEGNRLYAVSSAGLLLCLNAENGEVKWERDLVAQHSGRVPRWGYALSPLIEGDLVFAMPGGSGGHSLAAFDKMTGEPVWEVESDVASYSSPLAATIGGVRQVVFLTGNRLLGVTPKDGELLWSFSWADMHNVNAPTPLLIRTKGGEKEETYFFITSGYGKGCALVKVDRSGDRFEAQSVYTNNELCCHFASPVLHGEYLYGLDETRDLTCLEVRSGKVMWRRRGFRKGSLLRVDDRLIVLGEQGRLALVECDPTSYREVARCQSFNSQPCWTIPVLADGRLFLRDLQEVVCLDVRKK